MRHGVLTADLAGVKADAIIVNIFDGEKATEDLAAVDGRLNGLLAKVLKSGEFEGKSGKTLLLHTADDRVLLVGAGKKAELDYEKAVQMAGIAARAVPPVCRNAAFVFRGDMPARLKGQALAEGAEIGLFKPDFYQSERKDSKLEKLDLVVGKADSTAAKQGLHDGGVLAEATNFARRLANEPSNLMTPTHLADAAVSIASDAVKVEILERADMERLNMGSLLGVAKGSDEPPKLIVMRYTAPKKSKVTVGLVGKGITFDTGGISIKPAAKMDEMKTDMSGGANVIGVMKALSELGAPVNVLGVVPATENMPGGHAIKPGDVLTASNGKTIEVLNTDAEGRLILADGLVYARGQGATHLVDIATLTGAVIVALGHVTTGVMGNNQPWLDQVLAAAKDAGEKMWQLPLFSEYADMMKGEISDLKNISGVSDAGSITAAGFLNAFAENTPWAHLDIAGTSWYGSDKSWMSKGATAAGLRTMANLVRNFAKG